MKKSSIFLEIILFFILFSGIFISAQNTSEEKVNIYFFWSQGCPHCAKEKVFLETLDLEKVKINSYEVTQNSENKDLLLKIGEVMDINIRGVPFTLIGDQDFEGWLNDETSGTALLQAINKNIEDNYLDIVKNLNQQNTTNKKEIPETITLPLFGTIKTQNLSLPLLTIIIGFLDGFNPCAMWVLLFLLSLLIGMKSKTKMWTLGTIFIIASAVVYFLFMAAWLNLFIFLGLVLWVRAGIGIIAISAGVYNLREYITNKDGGCKITGDEKRQKIFDKIKHTIQNKNFFLAIFGIIILAFAVNLVELLCSTGLPVLYTQILTLTELSKTQYYLYLLLYVFVFMLDDLFVFFVAMITLQLTGISTKYTKISHLIGGILMLLIGLILILKPELLMFG